ncbi:MAG: hypothetical protein GY925_19740 [Actinomycetia bacterium]|nr:hypothetical protein [Actinomycetes bacterium]
MPDVGETWLVEKGISLVATFPLCELPEPLGNSLHREGVEFDGYRSAVLLGNAGTNLWPAIEKSGISGQDPIDDHSRAVAFEYADRWLGDADPLLLYPTDRYRPQLQLWSQAARWYHRSPLGMGIHPEFGLWQACRALLLVDVDLPLRREPPSVPPCVDCVSPCVGACPAGVLSVGDWPDMFGCLRYRVADISRCADRCVARLACPVAAEHRYPLAQIQHHYRDPQDTLNRHFPG